MNFFNAKYSSWQSTEHTVFGYALGMIFLVVKLGTKKEIFFKWITFFLPKEMKKKYISDTTVFPWGPQHEACITVSLYASSISWFLMAKSNETKEVFCFGLPLGRVRRSAALQLILFHWPTWTGEKAPSISPFLSFLKAIIGVLTCSRE